MSERTIIMSYHPALKKVKFESEDGRDLSEIYSLEKWTKNPFVLQNQGSTFFTDIIRALDGIQKINICFNGTNVDYEDFTSMVEHFNATSSKKIFCSKGSTLPDMNFMYDLILQSGQKASEVLQKMKYDLPHSSVTHEMENEINKKLQNNIDCINQKIDKLKSTNINICFVGTFSSGKSSLINAILEERILPEDDEPKTAKFFIINSPQNSEEEQIRFKLGNIKTIVFWNGKSLQLDNKCGTHEARTKIQECIDKYSDKSKNIQFYNLLEFINDSEDVDIRIELIYKIPIDSDEFKFTIYDTPGTGSNTSEHKIILQEALSDQENSIVVFVGAVTKLEGEGNSELLKLLHNEENSRIDLDRSIFVINRSDTTTRKKLAEYHNKEISIQDSDSDSDSITPIPLKDKKLFFTSAAQASAAMAYKRGIQTDDDEEYWEKISDYPFYELNRYGNSDLAKERMIEEANNAYQNANNEYDKAYIKVGLYSLVEAIREYASKYSMAVKVNALIEAINNSLNDLSTTAKNKKAACNRRIEEFNAELERIKTNIETDVNKTYTNSLLTDNDLPLEDQEALKVDDASINTLQNDIYYNIEKELSIGKKKDKVKKHIQKNNIKITDIYKSIELIMDNYTANFIKGQNTLLTNTSDLFISRIQHIVKNDDKLSEETKNKLTYGLGKNRNPSRFVQKLSVDAVGRHIEENTKEHSILWGLISWETVDTYKVKKDIMEDIKIICAENIDKFKKTFIANHNEIIAIVKNNFENNVEEFSCDIRTVKENRDAVLILAKELQQVSDQLRNLIESLYETAWREE